MKKSDYQFFISLIDQLMDGPLELDKGTYNRLAYHSKKAVRKSGLCIRKEMIAKSNGIKIPCLLIPIHIMVIDECDHKNIYMQIVFFKAIKISSNSYKCSLHDVNDSTDGSRTSYISFCFDNPNTIEEFIEINPSVRIKPKDMNILLQNILSEFVSFTNYVWYSKRIGWYHFGKEHRFYPIANAPLLSGKNYIDDMLSYPQAIANLEDLRSYPFLHTTINKNSFFSLIPLDYNLKAISGSDITLFASTLFAFCKRFFEYLPNYSPFFIYVYSDYANDDVWQYVSILVDLFLPLNATAFSEPAPHEDLSSNTLSRKSVKMVHNPVFSHIESRKFLKPTPFSKISLINREFCMDIPVIVKNSKAVSQPGKSLLTRKDCCALAIASSLPVVIRPEKSCFVPSEEFALNIGLTKSILKVKKNPYTASKYKEILLFLYKTFLEYLNNTKSDISKRVSILYKKALNDLTSPVNFSSKTWGHYASLLTMLYLLDDCLTAEFTNISPYYQEFLAHARQHFRNKGISSSEAKKPLIDDSEIFHLYKDFIKKSSDEMLIASTPQELLPESIGWYKGKDHLYLIDNYYDKFVIFCDLSGYVLPLIKKRFEKNILIKRGILFPQYAPSDPSIYPRYDIYKRINGQKFKTIHINLKLTK